MVSTYIFKIFGASTTVNMGLSAHFPFTSTLTVPVLAPSGTSTIISVEVELVTVPCTPELPSTSSANHTLFSDGTSLKYSPEIVTSVPTVPLSGVILYISGDGDSQVIVK